MSSSPSFHKYQQKSHSKGITLPIDYRHSDRFLKILIVEYYKFFKTFQDFDRFKKILMVC